MKAGYTHISAIMDRSGSMSSIKSDTEGGFNTFVADQKALPGEATISLTEFDDRIELTWDTLPIQDAPVYNLEPRGWTALLDAIGITINRLGQKLAAMDEADRPEKVVIVIVTDGEENKSTEYSYGQIAEMIKTQTETYNWEFMFLGANQDAILTGSRLGISAGKSMSYAANAKGVSSSYNSVSSKLCAFRSAAPGAAMPDFDIADRSMALGLDTTAHDSNLALLGGGGTFGLDDPQTPGAAGSPTTVIVNP